MSEEFKPEAPDYKLMFRTKQGPERKGNIGVAWLGRNGNIHIHLDPLVVLREQDDFQITLFPNNYKKKGKDE